MISGYKDTDLIILSKLDDKTLFSFCKIENSYIRKLCNDENFWRQRVKERFGIVKKNENRTWKNLYLNIIHYSDKYGIYDSMIKFNMLDEGKKNQDLLSFFEFQVLKRVYSKMIDMLRENLKINRFTEKERNEYIKRHNLDINKAAKEALDMWFLNLKRYRKRSEYSKRAPISFLNEII